MDLETYLVIGGGTTVFGVLLTSDNAHLHTHHQQVLKKLNTFNLPDSTIEDGSDYFNTVLYTGTGSSKSITVWVSRPDLVGGNHVISVNPALFDSVRGAS